MNIELLLFRWPCARLGLEEFGKILQLRWTGRPLLLLSSLKQFFLTKLNPFVGLASLRDRENWTETYCDVTA